MDKYKLFFTIYSATLFAVFITCLFDTSEKVLCISNINSIDKIIIDNKYNFINGFKLCMVRENYANEHKIYMFLDADNKSNIINIITLPNKQTDIVLEIYYKFSIYFSLLIPVLATCIILISYYITKNYKYIRRYRILIIHEYDDNECSICYEKLHGRICNTICNHKFHIPCLYDWLANAETLSCPLCRTIL